jgi:hypothetical protein
LMYLTGNLIAAGNCMDKVVMIQKKPAMARQTANTEALRLNFCLFAAVLDGRCFMMNSSFNKSKCEACIQQIHSAGFPETQFSSSDSDPGKR